MELKKPKLWKYKSGNKKGKLRPQAKKYLSNKLKNYYVEKKKREKIIKEQFREEKKSKLRLRNQKVLNAESGGFNIGISLRVIGFNVSEERLDEVITEFLNSNEYLLRIPFYSEGFESEFIDDKEDINLNSDYITIELNIRGKTTYTEY